MSNKQELALKQGQVQKLRQEWFKALTIKDSDISFKLDM